MKDWIIFSDGACSGNPGPGGWGAIVVNPDDQVQELGEGAPATTNNRMELSAVIAAIEYVCSNVKENSSGAKFSVRVISDSSYVLDGFKSRAKRWSETGWKTSAGTDVLNRDLWEKSLQVMAAVRANGGVLKYELVKGHAGIEANDRADEISVAFSKGGSVELYKGPLSGYTVSLSTEPFSMFYISFVDGNLTRHRTWDECSKATSGKKGAKFKKINSKQEEHDTLQSWGVNVERG